MNTRDKRSSAIALDLPWRGQYPLPDGALNQGDRQHLVYLYRGIAVLVPEIHYGLMQAAFSASQPDAAVAGAQPGMAVTATRPGAAVTGSQPDATATSAQPGIEFEAL